MEQQFAIPPLRRSQDAQPPSDTSHRKDVGVQPNVTLQNTSRRSFLRALVSLGAAGKVAKSAKEAETVYRFLTPECEVRMSVQEFGNSSSKDFRFLDRLTSREFCLSTSGEEDPSCQVRFSGAISVAIYHFLPRFSTSTPSKMRERVFTIDHDSRMSPRPPFERALPIERDTVSDIQAFGYNRNGRQKKGSNLPSNAVWSLLHQDLYLNDQNSPFLIVHWKHSLDVIRLIDVIPGDQTEVLP
jgi:hypothetical protein